MEKQALHSFSCVNKRPFGRPKLLPKDNIKQFSGKQAAVM
jgi:hypothetical protein